MTRRYRGSRDESRAFFPVDEFGIYGYTYNTNNTSGQYMPKKTIYVSKEDEPVWDEAMRMLRFYQSKGLSAFVTPLLRDYITKEKARQAKEKH
jgi:hypothetical protein